MIENVKEVIYIICCACVFTGVYSILVPDGKTKSGVRIALTLTLLFAILSPIIKIDFSNAQTGAETSTIDAATASRTFDQTLEESLRRATEQAIKNNIAEDLGVVKMYTSKDKNGNIYIVKVILSTGKKDQAVLNKVKSYLGGNVDVLFSEE